MLQAVKYVHTGDMWHVCLEGLKDVGSLCYGWRAEADVAWEGRTRFHPGTLQWTFTHTCEIDHTCDLVLRCICTAPVVTVQVSCPTVTDSRVRLIFVMLHC